MLYLIIFLMICFIGGTVKSDGDDGYAFVFIGSFIALTILGIGLITSAFNHFSDLATIRSYGPIIQNEEMRIKQLQDILKTTEIKTSAGQLMNADSPVAATTKALADAIDSLTEKRNIVASARLSIEERKIGLFRIIVTIYGDK